MIEMIEGKRRTLAVRCSKAHGEALAERGFSVRFLDSHWLPEDKKAEVVMCAAERDAFMVARGVFSSPVRPDHTLAPGMDAHAARRNKAAAAAALGDGSVLGVLLATPEWRGSFVRDDRDKRGRPVVYLLHPSGARAKLYSEGWATR